MSMGETRKARKCENRNHIHEGLFPVALIIGVVIGGLFGFFINIGDGKGDPDTLLIGRIYEVVAVDRAPGAIEDYLLLVQDRGEKGPKVEFMKVPASMVEGKILTGKSIMGVLICADYSCSTKTPRYKTGEFSELKEQLKELSPK